MSVTLRDLLEVPELDLTLLTGEGALGVSLRSVHSSELDDPTPWLSGGELLLTTGMRLKGADKQRRYVERLAEAGVAGLGFGVGFGFARTPETLVDAAGTLGFPVLEVPYPVPFIAISEAVSSRLAEERVRAAQLSVDVHDALSRLVAEGAGPADVLDELYSLTGGWSVLFGMRGEAVARSASFSGRDPAEVWGSLPPGLMKERGATAASAEAGPGGRRIAVPVRSGRHREGILVLGKDGDLTEKDRIAVRHGATLLGLLLASRRAVLAAERAAAGDVLQEAFAGRVTGAELVRRLELSGFSEDPIAAIVVEHAPEVSDEFAERIEWAVETSLVALAGAGRAIANERLVAALVPGTNVETVAEKLLGDLDAMSPGRGPTARIGVGAPTPRAEARRSFLAALFALRAAPSEVRMATQERLGAYRFLLGGQPEPVLADFVTSVLGPLIDRDDGHGSELVRSVGAFVEHGGRWEPGAAELRIHRHTLRYRIQQAEEVLGRDLSSPHVQLEILLALKAREILSV